MSLSVSASLSVSRGCLVELEAGSPGSDAAADENAWSKDVAGELPSTLGRLASLSADEVSLLGVVSGEDSGDDDEELDELLESCVHCSPRSGHNWDAIYPPIFWNRRHLNVSSFLIVAIQDLSRIFGPWLLGRTARSIIRAFFIRRVDIPTLTLAL